MDAHNKTKQLTEEYIDNLKEIESLRNYEVIINIEPLEKYQIEGISGFIEPKNSSKNEEVQEFIMIRQPNGYLYNYRGKLTMTVK